MCGISGFIADKPQPIRDLTAMTDIIHHRGPDDEGYAVFSDDHSHPLILGGRDTPCVAHYDVPEWFPKKLSVCENGITGNVGFGHRRLSILDLSPYGHQPMSYAEQRYWITYNGEIYNYTDLRSELESLGHNFISSTDTEIILAAYAQWGRDCLHRFNGMWAFAIYDRRTENVFLARDRFGVKPLYYWISDQGVLYFGSEIKQFTTLPGWNALLNQQRAYDFLVWGITDHTDETMFDGVFHIAPGHYVDISVGNIARNEKGRLDCVRWYEIQDMNFSGSFGEASAKFHDLLDDSVRLHLRSDVPVGSCLSGGLDSSAIVCLMNKALREKNTSNLQKTFSALSDVADCDEKKWVDDVVRHANVQSFHVYPDVKFLFDVSEKITWHQDEPFGSTSIFAQWNVFELSAKNDVSVILDGQGADEQLFGYHSAIGTRLCTLFMQFRWRQFLREIVFSNKLHGRSYKWVFMRFLSAFLPVPLRNFARRFFPNATPSPIWIEWDVLAAIKASPLDAEKRTVRDFCRSQMVSTNLQMLLHWEDRDSMAHSIESRVPFLDHRLVEFSMSLPDDYKIFDGVTKRVLRSGLNGVIPNSVRDRMDKIGFATPEESWVRDVIPDIFRTKMKQSIDNSKGVLNDHCLSILEDVIAGRRPFNFVLWRMINFGEWMKLFSVQIQEKA